MTDNPKYINYEGSIFIFPPFVDHSEFARKYGMKKSEIDGAGFVNFFGINGPTCYGKSLSLDITCNEEIDTYCLQRMLKYGEFQYR